jgi:MGT family glycosyltransferase
MMQTRKHIAMIGFSTPSHVYPSLAVIRELVRRGHRVSYAIGDGLAGLVEPTGVELVTHPSTLPGDDGKWPGDAAVMIGRRLVLDEAIRVLPRLVERYSGDPPDLLLYDLGALAAPVLSARYGIPAVQLSPAAVGWEGFEQDNAVDLRALRTSPAGQEFHGAYTAWLRENGIERDAWEWMADVKHTLALIPRAMQPHADRVRSNVRFVGPCLDPERLADQSWTPPPERGRRVLLVSLGTVYNDRTDLFRACLDAFADSDWHLVMALGKRIDPADLGPIPTYAEVHQTVPQLAVLTAASAFVTHAGMGGCSESLWFGVPTVAIPLAADQFANAAMLESLGVGRQLPADAADPAALRRAVESVAGSAEVAARLADLRVAVRADAGAGVAADAVESFLN